MEGYPGGDELVFRAEGGVGCRSMHAVLKYRFNIPFRYEILIFCTWKIKFSILGRCLRVVCGDRCFILFSVWDTNSIPPGYYFVWNRGGKGRDFNLIIFRYWSLNMVRILLKSFISYFGRCFGERFWVCNQRVSPKVLGNIIFYCGYLIWNYFSIYLFISFEEI